MFRETVTDAGGGITEGTCTEVYALGLLGRGVRLGCRTEASRRGGATIERDVYGGGHWAPRKHTVTLEPVTPVAALSASVRADLAAIGRARAPYLACEGANAGRIVAGFPHAVPPATAARLLARGLVSAGARDGGRTPVALSLAARLAMLAQDHLTSTTQPRGWHRPADYGEESTCGIPRYDRGSVAGCSCRTWSLPCEDRDDARRKGHWHRQQVTAGMVLKLCVSPAGFCWPTA